MGREMTRPVEQLHHRLGRAPDQGQLGLPDEVHVRARVDLAQHPVDVERVGAEVEVEALGQHHLEDVAGQDVLLGHLDRPAVVARRAVGERDLGQLVVDRRRLDQRLVERAGPVDGQLVEPGHGLVVERVEVGGGRRRPARSRRWRSSVTRWRKWSKAASSPMTDSTASG